MMAEGNFGVMGPVPVYPSYSAYATLHNGHYLGYYLDESKQWGMDMEDIERVYKKSVDNNIDVKCLVIINPGNPTGNVLD